MVTCNRLCSECGKEMLLDRVEQKGTVTKMFYTCVNPHCRECGKAYATDGKETEAHMSVDSTE